MARERPLEGGGGCAQTHLAPNPYQALGLGGRYRHGRCRPRGAGRPGRPGARRNSASGYAPVPVRIAEAPKCASDPHVVCALRYGRKSECRALSNGLRLGAPCCLTLPPCSARNSVGWQTGLQDGIAFSWRPGRWPPRRSPNGGSANRSRSTTNTKASVAIEFQRVGRASAACEEPNVHRRRLRRSGPQRAATARTTPSGPSPRRPRPPKRACSPSVRAGSGCCRCARPDGWARARSPGPARSTPASAPSPAAAARKERRQRPPPSPARAACSAGVTRAATITVRHSATGAPRAGSGEAAHRARPLPQQRDDKPGVLRGAQRPLAEPQCSTLRRLALPL